jgi:prophage regulatory protein
MSSLNKLLRIADVSAKTTLAKSTIWLKISQGKFPKPIKLGDSINVWMESDIDSWINSYIPISLDTQQSLLTNASLPRSISYEFHQQSPDENDRVDTRSPHTSLKN